MQETTSISKGGIVMAETQHKMVLSTTEPNNGINLVRIRQGDVLTQKFVVEVVEHGKLKTFDGLVPFFINTTKFGENQPVEQKVQEYSPAQARLVYTLSEPDWQWGGENTAHFSFRSLKGDGTWSEQFSTQDFTYRVISGISRSQLRDSGYVWTFEDLLRKFKDYMDQGKNDWEDFVNQNREIIESVDPGGLLLSRIGIFESFRERDFSVIEKMKNEFSERGVNVKWFGAIGDGESDDTAAIQDAIRFAKTTKSKTYFPSGNYRLTEELILLEGTYLLCDGNVRFLRDHDRNFTLNFELTDEPFSGYEGYGNITVDGGYWDFHSNNTADGQCFFFAHAKNVKIQNAHVKDVSGGHAVDVNSTDGMIIRNCIFEGYQGENFRGAIQIDLDKEGAFGDLYVDHQSFDYTVSKNVLVENCKFLSSELGSWGRAVESHSAVVDRQFEKITVKNCDIYDCLTVGIRAYNWTDVLIDGNRLYNCAAGIIVNTILEREEDTIDSNGNQTGESVDIKNFEITNNIVVHPTAQEKYVSSIAAWGQNTGIVRNVTIANNVCDGGNWSGIFVYKTNDFSVANNVIKDSGNNGISVRGSKRGTVSGNTIDTCAQSGIYVSNSTTDESIIQISTENVSISNNVFSECGVHGIHVVDNSSAVTVANNQLKNTSKTSLAESILIGTGSKNCIVADNIVDDEFINSRAILASNETTDITISDNKIVNPSVYSNERYISNDCQITSLPFTLSAGITQYVSNESNRVYFYLQGSKVACRGNIKGVDSANKTILKLPIPPKKQQYFTGVSTAVSGRGVITRLTTKTDGYLYLENNSEGVYNAADFVSLFFEYEI